MGTNRTMTKKIKYLMRVNALLRGCFFGSLLVIAIFIVICIHLAVQVCEAKEIEKNEVIEIMTEGMNSNPTIELEPLEVEDSAY